MRFKLLFFLTINGFLKREKAIRRIPKNRGWINVNFHKTVNKRFSEIRKIGIKNRGFPQIRGKISCMIFFFSSFSMGILYSCISFNNHRTAKLVISNSLV